MKLRRINLIFALAVALCVVGSYTFVHAQQKSAEPIVIGVPSSISHIEAKDALKAIKMAAHEINAKGGVAVGSVKRPMKVVELDTRDAAPGVPVTDALLGMEKLILEQKPTAILIGPYRSEAFVAGMDIIAKYKVPTMCTLAMSPSVRTVIQKDPEKYKYVFRTTFDVKYFLGYLSGIMDYINKTYGFDKVYIMIQDVEWTRKTADLMKSTYFEKQGSPWKVLGHERFPTGTSNFSSSMMKVRAQGAQVIFSIFDMPQSGTMIKQWKSMKIPSLMVGYNSPITGAEAWKAFDGKIGGAIQVNFELGSSCYSSKVPKSKEFYDNFQKMWKSPMFTGHSPAASYESVYIIKDAIERAGSTDPDKLVKELEKTDRSGAMGRIRYDKDHMAYFGDNPKEAALACAFQWRDNGSRVIVFPESIADGKIELPKGLKSKK
jgi:branched-chain amino acid transport system substrate-binding protein